MLGFSAQVTESTIDALIELLDLHLDPSGADTLLALAKRVAPYYRENLRKSVARWHELFRLE